MREGPDAAGQPRGTAPRPDLRLLLRPLSWRHSEHPGGRRHPPERDADRLWRAPRGCLHRRRGRLPATGPAPDGRAGIGRSRLRRRQHAHAWGIPVPATPSSTPTSARPSCCPATARSSRWSSPGSIRPRASSTKTLRDALAKLKLNDASLQLRAGDLDGAWASASAAAFSACCTWRSWPERLQREFNLDLITTVPTVEYYVYRTDGTHAAAGESDQAAGPGRRFRGSKSHTSRRAS